MSDQKQLSFVADTETVDLIEKLKKDMKAPTTAALFRKLLVLGEMANEHASKSASNGVLKMRGKNEPPEAEVSIALKM